MDYQNLNENQRRVIQEIVSPPSDDPAPPLLVFGPFGTGKTYTLHQAIRRIVLLQKNRVLICTHSNSAADIHVELLHRYLKEKKGPESCRPLRIYSGLRKASTVSKDVKEYCLVKQDGAFQLPTRDDVIGHRVIVTTLSMARALFDKQLPDGFFSHILIDEAAQALEAEALAPLTLAGNRTKVVFAGDFMQVRLLSLLQGSKWRPIQSLMRPKWFDWPDVSKQLPNWRPVPN